MKRIAETERLLVREFGIDDAEAFFAFNSDPEVMKYTGESPTESIEQARRMLRKYPDYQVYVESFDFDPMLAADPRGYAFDFDLFYLSDLEREHVKSSRSDMTFTITTN